MGGGMARRRIGELQRGVFKILLECPDGLPAKEVLKHLEKVVPPNEFEKSEYPNRPGVKRFDKIVRFNSIPLVKAGWLIKSKGRWYVTEEGKQAYGKYSDPEAFSREARRLYMAWSANQPEEAEVEEEAATEPTVHIGWETAASLALEEAEESAWGDIRRYLTEELEPYDFQSLVAGLLRAMGYHVSWEAPPGPDKGIDIVAHTDPLGASGPRIKVQVKRRADKVNVEGLRAFMALLGEHDVGIFVSAGGFTSDAEIEARTQEKRKITLLDLEKLFDLWVEYYAKLSEVDRRWLPLKPVHYLAPFE